MDRTAMFLTAAVATMLLGSNAAAARLCNQRLRLRTVRMDQSPAAARMARRRTARLWQRPEGQLASRLTVWNGADRLAALTYAPVQGAVAAESACVITRRDHAAVVNGVGPNVLIRSAAIRSNRAR